MKDELVVFKGKGLNLLDGRYSKFSEIAKKEDGEYIFPPVNMSHSPLPHVIKDGAGNYQIVIPINASVRYWYWSNKAHSLSLCDIYRWLCLPEDVVKKMYPSCSVNLCRDCKHCLQVGNHVSKATCNISFRDGIFKAGANACKKFERR